MSLDDQPLTLADFKKLMREHEENEAKLKAEMVAQFMAAFPDEDPIGHCAFHQDKIDAARAEKEFWDAAKLKVLEAGVSGLAKAIWIILGLAVFGLSLKLGLKVPPIGGV